MAEPFKLLLNAARIEAAAGWLRRHDSGFDAPRFVRLATDGLDTLEMKARAMQIADALQATLPPRFAQAAALLTAAMATPREPGEPWAEDGLSGWMLWPVGEYAARAGLDEPDTALALLHALTQRFSAEFAIRPFIVHHPQPVLQTLQHWTADPSAHVRRLVSEGSRPRLPWGLRLQALVADPTPTLPLLRVLQDDSSEYVRRSVANHLNDIAKDHPDLVAQWVQSHRPGASANTEALLRHASRGLIKQGHAPTLAAWGLGLGLQGQAQLVLSARRARVGDDIGLEVRLTSQSEKQQTLVVDYVVHHMRANGGTSPKVFKGWKLVLAPGATSTLSKRHSLRPVTTRTLYPGRHRIDVQVNGSVCAQADFELLTGRRPGRT